MNEFHHVMDDIERLRRKIDENCVSLNEDLRKKELQNDKSRKAATLLSGTLGRAFGWV